MIIPLFVVYHILDLTTGQFNPVSDPDHPYVNVIADFAPRRWPVTLVYALGVVAVGFHPRHSLFSAPRSLGQQTPCGERRAPARLVNMVSAHDQAGFGGCTSTDACVTVCPKGFPLTIIGRLNRDYLGPSVGTTADPAHSGAATDCPMVTRQGRIDGVSGRGRTVDDPLGT